MKEIQLTQNKVALVDDEDYDYLMQWKWLTVKCRKSFYAGRQPAGPHSGRKLIFMHRVIMETPIDIEVDHIDFNGLNNQRYNLRNCTHQNNKRNNRGNCNNKTGYVGVKFIEDRRKHFRAAIGIGKKTVNLPYYHTAEEAARSYDEAAIKYFGEFACLNFPEEKSLILKRLSL